MGYRRGYFDMAGSLMISLCVLLVCSAKEAIGNDISCINGLYMMSILLVFHSLLLRIVEDMLGYLSQTVNDGVWFRKVRNTLLSWSISEREDIVTPPSF
jgi:hypothetical protein